jgi:hypothetical protein
MKNTKNFKDKATPSSNDYSKMPESSIDLVNKYGRCNVQATADTDNPFPHIAQGLPKIENRKKRDQEKKTREDAF